MKEDESHQQVVALTYCSDCPLNRQNILLKNDEVITGDTVFTINEMLESSKPVLRIELVPTTKQIDSHTTTTADLKEERKLRICSAITRIMKARGTLDHDTLVKEVTRMCSSGFVPEPSQITEQIEELIRKMYIERSNITENIYSYSP